MTNQLEDLDAVCLDRRAVGERRKKNMTAVGERPQSERRKTPRRRQIDPTTCEREYSPDEIEFMQAMDAYKRHSGRMFPTCSEVLEVVKSLGYVKLAPAEPSLPAPAVAVAEPAASSTTLNL